MYLIVGLGNPENEYTNTRHNMGFDVINKISAKYNISVNKNSFKGLLGTGIIEEEKVILLKPQTFMNLSGESIRECMDFYKISRNNIIIIYDDIDIAPGKIRIRKKGGSGSHNGMKSVINHLDNIDFLRIRVGIGRPEFETHLVEYVIGKVSKEDVKNLDEGIEKACEAVIEIIKNGEETAMNKYNIC